MKYDIIGDIHGHSNDLKALLQKLGYGLSENNYYYHPDRQVIFVGDYIDRGKNSREVVEIVRGMQENDAAIALMGNHEYNALCFHTSGSNDQYLRPRTNNNIKQHCATLSSFDDEGFLIASLEWFRELPLFWENDALRIVHACWDPEQIKILKQKFGGNILKQELLEESATKKTSLYEAVEIVLKGRELDLPDGISFKDKDGHERENIRVKWWESPQGKSYKEYAVKLEKEIENLENPIPENLPMPSVYHPDDKPVFFGHYWLEQDQPGLQAPNVCCLDYSIAKGGKLVAYRFDGESRLDSGKFVFV